MKSTPATKKKFDFKKFIHEYGQFLQSYGSAHQKMDSEVSTLANKIPKL